MLIPHIFSTFAAVNNRRALTQHKCANEKAQNNAEAAKCYRKAAGQGHAQAQDALENYYGNCENVPQNYIEATKWWRDQLSGTKH